MKKKRLLAIFAAFAVAATMATGLTACQDNTDDKGDGTQTEQPGDKDPENPDPENPNNPGGGDNTDPNNPSNPGGGDNTDPNNPSNPGGGDNTDPNNPSNPGGGDNTDPNNPNNPGGGDNTDPNNPSKPDPEKTDPEKPDKPDDGKDKVKMTEAEWKKAVADSVATISYTCNAIADGSANDAGATTMLGHALYEYNSVSGIMHTRPEQTVTSAGMEVVHFSDDYYEISGTNLINYYIKDGLWYSRTTIFSSESDVVRNLLSYSVLHWILDDYTYKTPGATEVKVFSELYDAFTYDAENDAYVSTLIISSADDDSPEMSVTVKFADGKLSLFEFNYIVVESGVTHYTHYAYAFSGYNSTTLSVSKEIKEEANKNNQNAEGNKPEPPHGNTDGPSQDHPSQPPHDQDEPENPPHSPNEQEGYIGMYYFYSLTVDGVEYLAGETFTLGGEEIALTSDFMVIELKEGGVAAVSMSMGGMSETIECTWEEAGGVITIFMNGDPGPFYNNGIPNCLMMDGFLGLPNCIGTFKKA